MNIFVGNLNYQATEEDLQKLFSAYGNVSSAKVINDRFSGRSRGFGFVEMPDTVEGNKAIDGLNNLSFMQQTVVVNEAKAKTTFGSSRDSFSADKRRY